MGFWASFAAVLLAAGVGLGAFGAHALRPRFDAYQMGLWEKAVFYHLVNALGILGASAWFREEKADSTAGRAVGLLALGIFLFSGSLYTLAGTGNRLLGAITPLGGVAFLSGWLWLAWLIRARR